VSVAGQLFPLSAKFDTIEEGAHQVFVEHAFSVGAEGRVILDLVFNVQTDEINGTASRNRWPRPVAAPCGWKTGSAAA
jgi:hypothetical protein